MKLLRAAIIKSVFSLSFTLLLVGQFSLATELTKPSVMAEPQKPHVVVADIDQLYHWTSVPSLQRLDAGNKDKTKFPFEKDIGETTMIARSFPILKGIKGFFRLE